MSGTPRKAIALGAALQLVAAVMGARLAAQGSAVERLFPARPAGYVTDVAGVIDPAEAARMEELITRLRAATGAEIAVVTLPTIGDRDAAEVALAIGRKWGVGARADIGDSTRNAGLVILLVPRQGGQPGSGHIRIEVGRGLEGIVTDAMADAIQRNVLGPHLAREAYGPGLLAGVQALASVIARAYGVSDSALTAYKPPGAPGASGGRPQVLSLLPVLLFVVFIVMANAQRGGRGRRRNVYWGGPWIGGGGFGRGGFGGGGFGGGGFGGFGGGGGFSGGGAGGRF